MPAKENFLTRFKNSTVQKVNHFLYGERDSGYGYSSGAVYDVSDPPYEPEQQPSRRRRAQYREERYEQQAQEEQQQMYAQQAAYQQQMYGQQAAYQQQPVYQQSGYPQQGQAAYQAPMTQFAAQVEDQRTRNPQQPDPQKVVQFPGSYNGEQAQEAKPAGVRIITIRGFNDCRSAISYLRSGEILLVVMDGIQDQAEMRRYVDMMAGACFSLSASITKVSRYGSYLAAPGQISVWADPVISQMNGAGRRGTAPRTAQAPNTAYRSYAGEAQQNPYQGYGYQEPAPQQNPYTQNAADGTAFYARQPQPTPEQPPFEVQERGSGYAPDHEAEAL